MQYTATAAIVCILVGSDAPLFYISNISLIVCFRTGLVLFAKRINWMQFGASLSFRFVFNPHEVHREFYIDSAATKTWIQQHSQLSTAHLEGIESLSSPRES